MSIAVSSGHSKYVAGAIGIVKEVEEARKITDRIADLVDDVMPVHKFHDDISRTQRDNLDRIVAFHNSTGAKYHYSMHLNSSGGTANHDLGIEVLYLYESDKLHAQDIANAISAATGLKNRGAKKRDNLAFLCAPKRLLIEAYFVNSRADVAKMDEVHEVNAFATACARVICKQQGVTYQQSPSKPHRVQSGGFKTKTHAENAKQVLGKQGIASTLYTRIVQDGDVWRFITGTYASKIAADNAISKMRQLGILQVAQSIEA